MGFWDDINPVKIVTNVAKEVGKGVENITKETSKGVVLAGQVTSNIGNLVGGDVGKGINAFTGPIGGFTSAAGSAIGGDLKGAVGRATGAWLGQTPGSQALNASSSVEDLARHETINGLTLGMSNDAAEVKNSGNYMMSTGEVRDNDLSAIGRQAIRTGAIVGTVGLYSAATQPGMGTAALNAGKSGVGFVQGAGGLAAGVQALAKDPVAAAAGYLGFDKELSDIREITDSMQVAPPPAANRNVASAGNASSSSFNLQGIMPIVAIVGVALTALTLVLKRK